jgi:hypothetical protein
MLEGPDGAHHMVSMWDRVVPPLLVLVASPIDLFFLRSSISRKNDVVESLGPFDVLKVRESQKHAKTRKSKPNERGLFRKPLESMANKSRSLYNYQITKNMI